MAFHFTLNIDDIFINGASQVDTGEDIAFVDIGYDDDGTTYKILVALVPVTAAPPSYREIFFSIIAANEREGIVVKHRSGTETRSFLVGGQRETVLLTIAFLFGHMVKMNSPEVVIINTIETYLPDKALSKYEAICECICSAGYSGGRVDPYLGSQQWQLKKIDNA